MKQLKNVRIQYFLILTLLITISLGCSKNSKFRELGSHIEVVLSEPYVSNGDTLYTTEKEIQYVDLYIKTAGAPNEEYVLVNDKTSGHIVTIGWDTYHFEPKKKFKPYSEYYDLKIEWMYGSIFSGITSEGITYLEDIAFTHGGIYKWDLGYNSWEYLCEVDSDAYVPCSESESGSSGGDCAVDCIPCIDYQNQLEAGCQTCANCAVLACYMFNNVDQSIIDQQIQAVENDYAIYDVDKCNCLTIPGNTLEDCE